MKYCAEGGGELALEAQQKGVRFHGLPDSEIYNTEYMIWLCLAYYIECVIVFTARLWLQLMSRNTRPEET